MDHRQLAQHEHTHGAGCGHQAIQHEGHTDYLHDGQLHHNHGGHVDECSLSAGAKNPSACTPNHQCGSHDAQHVHDAQCGHAQVPHDGHTDYLVSGHLHHAHAGHCDDHGGVTAA